jgi:hypothetical protein
VVGEIDGMVAEFDDLDARFHALLAKMTFDRRRQSICQQSARGRNGQAGRDDDEGSRRGSRHAGALA